MLIVHSIKPIAINFDNVTYFYSRYGELQIVRNDLVTTITDYGDKTKADNVFHEIIAAYVAGKKVFYLPT